MTGYNFKSRSWVREHPEPRGVVEFYGGEAIGLTPHLSYDALFDYLNAREYTIIAVPVPVGSNHTEIARALLYERREIRKRLHYKPAGLPNYWVGHSIGAQFIALLALLTNPETNKITFVGNARHPEGEMFDGMVNEPMLFIAPYIGDTNIPFLPGWLIKALRLDFRPTMQELEALLDKHKSTTFARSAMLSFTEDTTAGSLNDCPDPRQPCTKSVPWIHRNLTDCVGEVPGDHFTPMGTLLEASVYRPSLKYFSEHFPRPVDREVVRLLELLDTLPCVAIPALAGNSVGVV